MSARGCVLAPLCVLALALAPTTVAAYATFEIDVIDGDGEGFNDPTPVDPVGGNDATTVGAQRLAVLEHAASLWGALLDSEVPIVIEASFDELGCTEQGGVAAVGGTTFLLNGIDGDGGDPTLAYGSALADRLMGEDQIANQPDVAVTFNVSLGSVDCPTWGWYYGLDGDPGSFTDMVEIALHELGHGLGVQNFVDTETGMQALTGPDAFSSNVLDLDQSLHWTEMDDAGRVISAQNVRRVVWDGPHLTAAAAGYLEPGAPTLATTPDLGLSGFVGDAGYGARPLAMSVSAPLQAGSPANGCTPVTGVAGSVVLMRPECRGSSVLEDLEQGGALGALYVVAGPALLPANSAEERMPVSSNIPMLTITDADAQLLETALGGGAVTVSISATADQLVGADDQGRVYLYATQPITGSTLAHFDTLARPNLLMEPVEPPTPLHDADITPALLRDIGWEPFCGNGRLDQEEPCDDGDDNSDDTPDACRESCVLAACGDTVIDSAEECDDGDDNSDDEANACRTDCSAARCGDGVVDDDEACDDGDANSDSAADACRTDCSVPFCGDGVVDDGEVCDDGDANSDSEADACRIDCSAAACGDDVVDDGEQCDDGDENADEPGAECRLDCTPARCGDAVVDDGEDCDDGEDNSDSAADACRADCTAARCGDGVIDDGEQCDGEEECLDDCLLPGFERAPDGGIVEEDPDSDGDGGGGDDGCGCSVPGQQRGKAPVALMLSGLLVLGLRRRTRLILPLMAALLAAVLLAACEGDEGGDGSRGSRSGPGDESDGDDRMDGGARGMDGMSGFGNADAQPPQLPVPDGGFPDAATGGDDDDPDDDGCGSVELEPMVNAVVEPGNLLVVFDNSGSMSSLWNGDARWLVAANALRDAVSSLSEYLTVAAIVFPTATGGCDVSSIDSPEQIRFLPGSTFIAAWDNFMSQNSPGGGTPLGGALIAADQALMMSTLSGATNVIVLTDGAPGCDTTPLDTLPPAWLGMGIQTHVVGLPGSEAAETVLDNLAMGGGTMQHLQPDDARALRRQLAGIISETVSSALESCTIPLDPAAPNPDDVHVVVTEGGTRASADRDLGEGGGWTINEAGSELEFFGIFCDKGLAGDYDRISIEFGCVDLPPLEPPVLE